MDMAQFAFAFAMIVSALTGIGSAIWELRLSRQYQLNRLSLSQATLVGTMCGLLFGFAATIPGAMLGQAFGFTDVAPADGVLAGVFAFFAGGLVGHISANLATRFLAKREGKPAQRTYLHLPY